METAGLANLEDKSCRGVSILFRTHLCLSVNLALLVPSLYITGTVRKFTEQRRLSNWMDVEQKAFLALGVPG